MHKKCKNIYACLGMGDLNAHFGDSVEEVQGSGHVINSNGKLLMNFIINKDRGLCPSILTRFRGSS